MHNYIADRYRGTQLLRTMVPAMVIYTDAFDDLYQRILDNQVTVTIKPVNTPGYQYFHCLDLYRNEIIVVKLKEQRPAAMPKK